MITVSVAFDGRREIAVRQLFANCSEDEQHLRAAHILESARVGDLCLDGLLLAELDGVPAGAVLYLLQPDGRAFVWPPVVSQDMPAQPGAVADALLDELCRQMDAAGARWGQCLIESKLSAERDALDRHGFAHIADMACMQRWIAEPLPEISSAILTPATYRPGVDDEHFVRVLERTYVGTLDCPKWNRDRCGAQALASYQSSGEFDPRHWRVFRRGADDAGILLIGNHPNEKAWEIVYMGVVPEARGNGYAREMVLRALSDARDAKRASIFLAVDAQNRYAVRVYRELGFFQVQAQAVHIRTCAQNSR